MRDKSCLFFSATSGVFNLAGLGLLGVTLLNSNNDEATSIKIIASILLITIGLGVGVGYAAEKYGLFPARRTRIVVPEENTLLINPSDIHTASI